MDELKDMVFYMHPERARSALISTLSMIKAQEQFGDKDYNALMLGISTAIKEQHDYEQRKKAQ